MLRAAERNHLSADKSMRVAVDKSFLQGAPSDAVRGLCTTHQVVLPEAAFWELMTAAPEERAACFRKFPSAPDAIHLTTNSGVLMRSECQNRRPCDVIRDFGMPLQYQLNPRLGDPTFQPEPNDLTTLDEWSRFMAGEVKRFKVRAAVVGAFAPELSVLKAGRPREVVQSVLDRLAGDSSRVMEIYAELRTGDFPPREIINSAWAVYRTLQVQLLAAVEYVRRYGSGAADVRAMRVDNDVIDMEYCILGSLTGALATRDAGLMELFRLARPDGVVFQ